MNDQEYLPLDIRVLNDMVLEIYRPSMLDRRQSFLGVFIPLKFDDGRILYSYNSLDFSQDAVETYYEEMAELERDIEEDYRNNPQDYLPREQWDDTMDPYAIPEIPCKFQHYENIPKFNRSFLDEMELRVVLAHYLDPGIESNMPDNPAISLGVLRYYGHRKRLLEYDFSNAIAYLFIQRTVIYKALY